MNKNNIGLFTFSSESIRENPDFALKIFQALQFVPVKAEMGWYKKEFQYTGLSPLFSEITEGQCVPAYILNVVVDKDGEFISLEPKRIT